MICPKCKESISDEVLICPVCSEESARVVQAQKCEEIRKKTKGLLDQEFHSKSYLIYMIFLAMACLIGVISLFNSLINANFMGAVLPVAFTACAISSLVRMLNVYKSKGEITAEQIKKLTAFISFMITLGIFECIGFGIVALVVFAVGMSVYSVGHKIGSASEDISDIFGAVGDTGYEEGASAESIFSSFSSIMETGSALVLFIFTAIAVLLMVYAINFTITYTSAKSYYYSLAETAEKCTYKNKKVPFVRSYIFGGLTALLGLVILVMASAAWQIALLFIGIGGYTIVTGMWFKTVHEKQIGVHDEYCNELKKLEEIQGLTVQERCRIANEQEKKRLEEEERQRIKAAEEREEARLNQQQQQLMMQQMMQQMMANMQNGQKASTAQSEPVKETEEE